MTDVGSSSIPPGELSEGQTVAGKYRITRMLGAGGMCLVYEAEHIHLKQAIALKLLKPDLAKDQNAVARFAQEAQASAQLRSPNVARVYDVDRLPDGQPYITMELLVGHDLGTELQRRYSLPLDLAVDYVRQAALGISEAHALGIVHRDLKPENLFLTELGALTERRLLKILDFGIAKNVQDGSRKLTAPDAVFGTVDYMSPEQIRSSSTVDRRTDIWSLGVILFELLTGQTPYSGDARSVIAQIVSDPVMPPSRFVPTLPPGLVDVVMKALAKDPDQRFQSAEHLRVALEPYCHGIEPITDVLARVPLATVPRRNVDAPRLTPEVRDVRTNLAFETTPSRGGWAKRAAIVPLCGAVAITLLGVIMWKKHLLAFPYRRSAPAVATSAPPAETSAPAEITTTVAVLSLPAASGSTSILGASSPADAPSASHALPPNHGGAPKRATTKTGPPPARSSAALPPASASAPAPSATPTALPKHI